jgi:hypothetical protein
MITDIGLLMDDSGNSMLWCTRFIRKYIGIDIKFVDAIEARIFTKSILVNLYRNSYEYNEGVLDSATEYTKSFLVNPFWSFLYSVREDVGIVPSKGIVGSTIQVEINQHGKIKKGGKKILALELFKKHILDVEVPMSNKEFILLLISELDMTKLGANTYLNGLRTTYGMVRPRKGLILKV